MTYTETDGYSGELFVTYDNFGNMADLRDNSGSSVKAVLVDPNNSAITQYYNPADIDDPFTYKARAGFIGIEPWVDGGGTVYLQGHPVIPNPWGDVVTNGTTTTDTVTKGGGDYAEPCGKEWNQYNNCVRNCFHNACEPPTDECIGDVNKKDPEAWNRWDQWLRVKGEYRKILQHRKFGIAKEIIEFFVNTIGFTKGIIETIENYNISVIDFETAMQIGLFKDSDKTYYQSYNARLKRENDCRKFCDKYNPLKKQ